MGQPLMNSLELSTREVGRQTVRSTKAIAVPGPTGKYEQCMRHTSVAWWLGNHLECDCGQAVPLLCTPTASSSNVSSYLRRHRED